MAVSAINIARVSNSMQTISLLDALRRNTLDLFLQQNRLSTGRRINAPSDDPVGAAKATVLTQTLERQEQILANLRHADSFLAATDSAIGEINDLLIDAHGIASEMVNTTADQSQRDSMAVLIRSMIDQLVTVGNRSYQDVFLFGGQQTRRTPFTQNFGGVEYAGDTGNLQTTVGRLQTETFNLTGDALFGALSTEVKGYVDLDPVLTEDTRLRDLDGASGVGVKPQRIRITIDGGVSFVVDLSEADTVGDVIDYIQKAAEGAGLAAGQVQVAINADGTGLNVTAPGNFTISEVGDQGKTARDLGIAGTGGGTINGLDINPRVTRMTAIDDLFGGAGATLGAIQITNGSSTATIDLSAATTVQEVLNIINTSGVQVVARINKAGTGIDVVSNSSGNELRIAEAGGDTAELLGMRSFHAGTLLSSLNDGAGVTSREGLDDFRVTAKDGTSFDVNIDGAKTIQDVVDLINAAATAAGVSVTAGLTTTGNGIELNDTTGGAGQLHVERLNLSAAIDGLGFTSSGAGKFTDGTQLVSDDVNGIKPDSVFSALIDLELALRQSGDDQEQRITRAAEKIQRFIDSTTRAQGLVGARSQAMRSRVEFTEDAVLSTQALLSEVRDLDYTEAITAFQQAQTTLQATLLTGSRLMELSLLNYI